ncbi:cullin-1-like [Melanaphis sacchari]|uniref:cullin-1-like n=1 Tax=Melanaphis sacchari TaxID=742174 RepID=UPI000DC13833|nr:cullin-1-like [Melanaphis sacchari]
MVFSNKHTTFHVNLNIQKDTQQEIEQNVKTTKDDHKLQLQATIIRIMKVRNTLRHKLLVNEIFSQSNLFFPTNALIKISIEELIDKGYLERNENVNDDVFGAASRSPPCVLECLTPCGKKAGNFCRPRPSLCPGDVGLWAVPPWMACTEYPQRPPEPGFCRLKVRVDVCCLPIKTVEDRVLGIIHWD